MNRREDNNIRGGLQRPTVKELCEQLNISERSFYYANFVHRHGIPEWRRLIWANKKGHTPKFSWIARVCKFADRGAQLELIDIIERDGIKRAREIWAIIENRHV